MGLVHLLHPCRNMYKYHDLNDVLVSRRSEKDKKTMMTSRIVLILFAFMLLMATIDARRRPRRCRLPPHPGRPCGFQNFRVQRFYYDSHRGRCMSFIYYGCGGNENRFRTHRACRRTCRF